jgi:predicted aspartyl protease
VDASRQFEQRAMRRPGRIAVVAALFAAISCCIDAAAAANCKLARIAEWPIRLERNHLLVDGAVNGQPVAILLDTGAALTLIFRASATRLGLPLQEARNMRMFGVGGETKLEVARVKEFRLGDAVRTDWGIYVGGDGNYGADVILGEEFFQLVDVEFDLAHDTIRLFQSHDCDGVSLAYWASTGIGEVTMDEVSPGHPQIVVPIELDGRPMKALIDSGASVSLLDKSEAAQLGVTPESPGVTAAGKFRGLGNRAVDSWIATFKTLKIGNETIRNVDIYFAAFQKDASYTETGSRIPTRLMTQNSMLLGIDFLRAHRVLVAHSQRRVYFTYTGEPVFRAKTPPPRTNLAPEPGPSSGSAGSR